MSSFSSWLRQQRTSTRLAFLLHVTSRIGNSLLSLLWTRLLVLTMGESLYGWFLNFQAVASLGGLGDLGLGGVVALRVGQHLGAGNHEALLRFLESARAVFLCLATAILTAGIALSPWLPTWFGFDPSTPGIGSATLLFSLGAASAAVIIASSYVNSVNYGAGTVTWPILPIFLGTQLSALGHWLLARANAPLTVQYLPYLVASMLLLAVSWAFVRVSHSDLARIRPLTFRWREWLHLAQESFWSYLWAIGNVTYLTVATLVIGKGFGGEQVTRYRLNSRLSELAFFFVITAGFVALPKLTQMLSVPDPAARSRAVVAFAKLSNIQAFLGYSAAVGYLVYNDLFITAWMGATYRVPLEWQMALALALVITTCASAVMQISARCGKNALRYSGVVVGITALLNIGLSISAMKAGSIVGVLLSGAVAQAFFSIVIGRFVCRYLGLSFPKWMAMNVVLPVLMVFTAYCGRLLLPGNALGYAISSVLFIGFTLVAARLTGITPAMLREEFRIVSRIFRRTGPGAASDGTHEE